MAEIAVHMERQRAEHLETTASSLSHRPEIDGLRAIAIVPVLLYHAGLSGFDNGFLGVDIFFVISGYLITRLLLDERRQTGTISILGFYERRVRRIVPALATVVASTVIGAWLILTPIRMEEFAASVASAFAFSANFWFLSQTHYFSTAADQQPLIHLWSLGVEEQFYLVFPLLLLLFSNASDRALVVGIGTAAVASLISAHFVSITSPDAAFYRPDTRAWELLLGSLCAFAVGERVVPFREFWAMLGVCLIGLSLFVLPAPNAPSFSTFPVCLGVAIVLVFASPESGIGRVLAAPGITHVGLISYSLYLWHQPLLALARIQQMGDPSPILSCLILLGSAALASATWYFVEKPFRDRNRATRASMFAGALAAASAFIGFGIAGCMTAGYPFRYGELAGRYFEALGVLDDKGSTRNKAIGMGVCHYRPDMSPPLEEFLANWKCTGSGNGATILVIGDSHAADKAAALKLNGVDVGQMTGAGCSAVPSLMAPNCRQMFDQILARYSHRVRFTTLMIANKQLPTIYTTGQIDEAINYWAPLGAQIFWFSDMPQFVDIEDWKARNLLANGDATKGAVPVTLAEASSSFEAMHGQENGRFKTIDSRRLFCSITRQDHCQPFLEGQGWLAVGGGHLSALGAYHFGRMFLADRDAGLDFGRR